MTDQETAPQPLAERVWAPRRIAPAFRLSSPRSEPISPLRPSPSYSSGASLLLSIVVDIVACAVALLVTWRSTRAPSADWSNVAPILALPLIVPFELNRRGLYRSSIRKPFVDEVWQIVVVVSLCVAVVIALCLMADRSVTHAALFARVWLYALVAVSTGRAFVAVARHRTGSLMTSAEPALIVGAGVVGSRIARRLQTHPRFGLLPVGFIDDEPRLAVATAGAPVPVLGGIDDFRDVLGATAARRVIIAFSRASDIEMNRLISICQELEVAVSVVPRMFDSINSRSRYETLCGLPLLSLDLVDPSGWGFALKYALDRVLAAVLLVALLPLLAVLAVLVRISSPGRVLVRQQRVGRDGHVFTLLKFRTMHDPDAPETPIEPPVGLAPGGVDGVDRRTRIGRILRRASLDELPQVFNVLKGDMSLVGPRPERPEFVAVFNLNVARYSDRHRVKSGITGWAQVNGLRGKTSMVDRVDLDNDYIANWSFGADLKILAMTVVWLFRHAE